MATIGQLVSDIELRLTKGNVSDDFQIDRRQIRFWLDSIRDELIAELEKTKGKQDLSEFIKEYDCIPIEMVGDSSDECSDKKYKVELPVSVSSLNGDLGVYRVETQAGETIYRTTASEKKRIMNLKFAGNSKSTITYRKVKNTLYIEGGTDNYKRNGKVNLLLIPNDTSSLSDEEDYPIDASLVSDLLDRAEAIGRRVMGTAEDTEDDGKQQ